MSIEHIYTIERNEPLTSKTRLLVLKGEEDCDIKPGQFVNIAVPGKYLRRPISIHGYSASARRLKLLYDVVGEGTEILSLMKSGEKLNILGALGNGFNMPHTPQKVFLLGGGIGCAPLFYLAETLKSQGSEPIVIFGFNTARDIYDVRSLYERYSDIETHIATVDGSKGVRGFVTDVIREKNLTADYFYACGPMPMLRALCLNLDIPGEVSLESRMGCGFGACMCCSLETKDGARRICKEGPVFKKEQLIWK